MKKIKSEKNRKWKRTWKVVGWISAGVVVFSTTYSLILPAITMEEEVADAQPGVYLENEETEWDDFSVEDVQIPDEDILSTVVTESNTDALTDGDFLSADPEETDSAVQILTPEEIPDSVEGWITFLKEEEAFAKAEAYEPAAGNLIFFDRTEDDVENPDHMGIVCEVQDDGGDAPAVLIVEEKATRGEIEKYAIGADLPAIYGYSLHPVEITAEELPEAVEEAVEAAVEEMPEEAEGSELWETSVLEEVLEAAEAEVPETEEAAETLEELEVEETPETKEISEFEEAAEVEEPTEAEEILEALETPEVEEMPEAEEVTAVGSTEEIIEDTTEELTETQEEATEITTEELTEEEETGISETEEETAGEDEAAETEAESEEADTVRLEKIVSASDGHDYKITLTAGPEAQIPADAQLKVTEIAEDTVEYINYKQAAEESLPDEEVSFARFFDITILAADGETELQPEAPVEVSIELEEEIGDEVKAIHFGEEDAQILPVDYEEQTAVLTAESFSVYGLLATSQYQIKIITAAGETFEITVTGGPEARIPSGAYLNAAELTADTDPEIYQEHIEASAEALTGDPQAALSLARLFDISILDENGEKIEPQAPVQVKIAYAADETENVNASELKVVHFATNDSAANESAGDFTEDAQADIFLTEAQTETVTPEVITPQTGSEDNGMDSVSFETAGFSLFTVVSLDDLNADLDGKSFIIATSGDINYFAASDDDKKTDEDVQNEKKYYHAAITTEKVDNSKVDGLYGEDENGNTWVDTINRLQGFVLDNNRLSGNEESGYSYLNPPAGEAGHATVWTFKLVDQGKYFISTKVKNTTETDSGETDSPYKTVYLRVAQHYTTTGTGTYHLEVSDVPTPFTVTKKPYARYKVTDTYQQDGSANGVTEEELLNKLKPGDDNDTDVTPEFAGYTIRYIKEEADGTKTNFYLNLDWYDAERGFLLWNGIGDGGAGREDFRIYPEMNPALRYSLIVPIESEKQSDETKPGTPSDEPTENNNEYYIVWADTKNWGYYSNNRTLELDLSSPEHVRDKDVNFWPAIQLKGDGNAWEQGNNLVWYNSVNNPNTYRDNNDPQKNLVLPWKFEKVEGPDNKYTLSATYNDEPIYLAEGNGGAAGGTWKSYTTVKEDAIEFTVDGDPAKGAVTLKTDNGADARVFLVKNDPNEYEGYGNVYDYVPTEKEFVIILKNYNNRALELDLSGDHKEKKDVNFWPPILSFDKSNHTYTDVVEEDGRSTLYGSGSNVVLQWNFERDEADPTLYRIISEYEGKPIYLAVGTNMENTKGADYLKYTDSKDGALTFKVRKADGENADKDAVLLVPWNANTGKQVENAAMAEVYLASAVESTQYAIVGFPKNMAVDTAEKKEGTVALTSEAAGNTLKGQQVYVFAWEEGDEPNTKTAFIYTQTGGTEKFNDPESYSGQSLWRLIKVGENKFQIVGIAGTEDDKKTAYLYLNDDGNVQYTAAEDLIGETAGNTSVAPEKYTFTLNEESNGRLSFKNSDRYLTIEGSQDNWTFKSSYTVPGEAGDRDNWTFVLARIGIDRLPKTAQKVNVNDLSNNYKAYDAEDSETNPFEIEDQDYKVIVYYIDKTTGKYYAVDNKMRPVEISNTGDTVTYFETQADDLEWIFSQHPLTNSDGVTSELCELRNTIGYNMLPSHPDNDTYPYKQTAGDYPLEGSLLHYNGAGGWYVNLPGRLSSEKTYGSAIENWDGVVSKNYGIGLSEDGETFVAVEAGSDEELEFYFASVLPVKEPEQLREVDTVDSVAKGITIKMYDWPSGWNGDNSRSQPMQEVIGERDGGTELVSNKLNQNGYPDSTKTNHNLIDMFADTYYRGDANHLFIQSVYDSTGYFQFRSTDHYAFYKDGSTADGSDGNFTVYDAVGVPSSEWHQDAMSHGNFLPFNNLTGKEPYDPNNYYVIDDQGQLIPTDDARFGKRLYDISDVDYHFGMTMETSFIQPKDGKIDGEDMIFEFNGDDDMWVFIDGVLVLDIGGTHGPRSGKINFATGEVEYMMQDTRGTNDSNVVKTYLKELLTKDGVDVSKFDENTFKDYSKHTLKAFYMERGAGASNLVLNFNICSVPEGQFTVEKQMGGEYDHKYGDARFPYRAYLEREDTRNDFALIKKENVGLNEDVITMVLTGKDKSTITFDGEGYIKKDARGNTLTFDSETGEYISFSAEGTPKVAVSDKFFEGTNGTNGIFYLRPGEKMSFTVKKASMQYYVQELGISEDMVDVTINGDEAVENANSGPKLITLEDDIPSGIPGKLAAQSMTEQVSDRPQVTYVNSPKNLGTLEITKQLSENEQNPEGATNRYTFYVTMPDTNGVWVPYVGDYYVKDKDGKYYTYADQRMTLQQDESNNPRTKDTADPANKSGSNGSIEGIPAGYTVEIRNLLPGTEFKVVEAQGNGALWKSYTVHNANPATADATTGAVNGKNWSSEVDSTGNNNATRENGAAGAIQTTLAVEGENQTVPTAQVIVTNELQMTGSVTIRKVDETTVKTTVGEEQELKTLSGAEFTLSYWDGKKGADGKPSFTPFKDSDGTADKKITTNDDGIITIPNLPLNQYYKLTEKKAPDGYIMTTSPDTYFYLDEQGEVFLTNENRQKLAAVAEVPSGAVIVNSSESNQDGSETTGSTNGNTDKKVIQIPNTPGIALPSTGGIGTRVYTVTGSILLAFAALGYLFRRVKKK